MSQGLRVVFMGTPDFAVPSLRMLVTERYEVVAVVTQPDKPTGRKKMVAFSPVKQTALEYGLPILQPQRVRSEESLMAIRRLSPDVLITAAYGQILPQTLLDIPHIGSLNVHASILPRWRGAAPIHRALMAGDKETGVSVMEMVLALDAGPVYSVASTKISEEDNVQTLHDRLAQLGAKVLSDVLPRYALRDVVANPQSENGVTYAHRILREDEFISWKRPSLDVFNHIRGLSPWPGATAKVTAGDSLKVWSAACTNNGGGQTLRPGECILQNQQTVVVGCGDGVIQLFEVQPAGKRRMSAADWFRGLQAQTVQFSLTDIQVKR